jgi:hypothetical protein
MRATAAFELARHLFGVFCPRRRAYAALLQFTRRTIAELQADDDEILRGVDWSAVACTADMCKAVKKVLRSSNTITTRHDGGGRSALQSSELLGGGMAQKRGQKSKAALGTVTAQSSLLSGVYSSSDDAYFSSAAGSTDLQQQGLGGGSEDLNPGSPMFLTRANLAAASSRSFRGLTVPLLGRQYSSRAAERYSSTAAAGAAGGDGLSEGSGEGFDAADDVESGLLQQQQVRARSG